MVQTQDFSFLILIFISFFLVKAGFDPKAFDSIPKLLFNLCFPALILISFSGADGDMAGPDAVFMAAFAVAYTVVVYPLTYAVLWHYRHAARKDTLALNMIMGNITFVGLPFIYYFFGAWGARLAIFFGAVQDFFIWSVCYWMFSGKGSFKQTLKVILNPCFVAIIIGFALAGTGFKIPDIIISPVNMLAGTTVPLALLCIGSLLAQNTDALKRLDLDAVLSVIAKTFVLPAIVFITLTVIGADPALALLSTLITALPVGLLSVIFAKEFGKDVAFANVVFVLSTLVFIMTCFMLFLRGVCTILK